MTGRQWIRLLRKHGWKVVKITSSHHLMMKGNLTEMIARHTRDIGRQGELKLRKKLEEGDK